MKRLPASVLVAATVASGGCGLAGPPRALAFHGGPMIVGIVGRNNGSTARGAIIGAMVGGAAGAEIGRRMDRQAKELRVWLPEATIERVGEGIQITVATGRLYLPDSDAIRADAAGLLRDLSTSLKHFADTEVLVVGHSDGSASAAYDQELSARRANSVSHFITGQGISADRLRASGRGAEENLASNETESGRRLNRRIEIAIYAVATARER